MSDCSLKQGSKNILITSDGFTHRPSRPWSTTACGPRKLFLRPARAFSIVENVAKARPRINHFRSRISSILQRNFCMKVKYSLLGPRGKLMSTIWPFELSELSRPGLVQLEQHQNIYAVLAYTLGRAYNTCLIRSFTYFFSIKP